VKTNPVKRKLKAGEPSYGTWLSLGDIYATRVLARMGFDWLTLDIEHSPIDWSQAGAIFGCIADAGCVPLARVPKGNHDYIKRCLDAGAWGIVVPMVDTVEQAKIAVAAAKYPPTGNRSLGGGLHAINFETTGVEYFQKANDEILVILQTESPTGVANAREIYSLPASTRSSSARSTCGHRCARRMVKSPPTKNSKPCSSAWSMQEKPSARPQVCTRWTSPRPSAAPSKGCSSSPSAASCDS
jgi:hypothetical protein